MASKLNWDAWARLLEEDVAWLREQPRTLERDHAVQVLEHLAKRGAPGSLAFYEAIPAPSPPA